ncbi:sugar phosphate exchanger 3-like isoform X2 [Elysia marginata]|uniref:Sugar phosphate exchanger 3-like isoform X2 n=1 Tax=Elysia marginata TaxID=1093978 RepID=A0AAV4J6Y2_9GAST|nr:sugar phosphate exchanger 3-like isoform X2 [Elysia marginata]
MNEDKTELLACSVDRKASPFAVDHMYIDSFGSIGTCIEGPIIGAITAYAGWTGMFYLMIGLSACGTLATYKAEIIYRRVNKPTPDFIAGV